MPDETIIIPMQVRDAGYTNDGLWITVPHDVDPGELLLQASMCDAPLVVVNALVHLANLLERLPQLRTCFWFWYKGRWIPIPPGFVLDYYSIPRLFWWWWPPRRGLGDEAALIHDFICAFWALLGLTRADGDHAFLLAMNLHGIRTSRIKHRVVRRFGWLVDKGGEGKRDRKVKRAMEARANDWEYYACRVKGTLKLAAYPKGVTTL